MIKILINLPNLKYLKLDLKSSLTLVQWFDQLLKLKQQGLGLDLRIEDLDRRIENNEDFTCLAKLKSLKALTCRQLFEPVSVIQIQEIAKLNQLQKLSLSWIKDIDSTIFYLAALHNLKSLSISTTYSDSISNVALEHLAAFNHLQELDLDVEIGPEELKCLSGLINLQNNLKSLRVKIKYQKDIIKHPRNDLQCLKELKNLEIIELDGEIAWEDLEQLLPMLPKLKCIKISFERTELIEQVSKYFPNLSVI